MTDIILAGNGVTARILASYLADDRRYRIAGAVVDDAYVAGGQLTGISSVGVSDVVERFPPSAVSILMAMGYDDLNRSRAGMFARLKALGYTMETYVHPGARVYTRAPLGEGAVIMPGAVVEPEARVGADSFIWANVTVAHDASVGDHCWIAAGATLSGMAQVGDHGFIGVNATIVNKIAVAAMNVIGAGALVTKATKPNTVHLARSAEEWRYSAEDYVKFFGV